MYYKYFRDIPALIKNWRNIYWINFRGQCPNCESKRLHFIEGRPKFEKWFCTDCTTMSYIFECKKCGNKEIQVQSYKPHIYKEYRLGKYRDDKIFFNACQREYFNDRINFHKQGLKEWRKLFRQWKKRKHRSVLYSNG
jgi:hypothetical protein